MVQDPCTLPVNVNYPLLFTKKPSPHVMANPNPKRYATYFPSKASIEAGQQHDASEEDGDDDEYSTWEFNAPTSHSSRSSSSTNCTSVCTPAQEIIFRYRSGIDSRSSSPSRYSEEPDCWEMEMASPTALSHSEYVPDKPDQGMKARYRQSRYDALQNTVCQNFSFSLSLCGVSSFEH